jgi:hypothetical protein
MNRPLRLLRDVAGLFFDDGSLAIVVLVILAATAILRNAAWFDGPIAVAFLVGGVTAALLENVLRTARAAANAD